MYKFLGYNSKVNKGMIIRSRSDALKRVKKILKYLIGFSLQITITGVEYLPTGD